jgi:hypothetical protein
MTDQAVTVRVEWIPSSPSVGPSPSSSGRRSTQRIAHPSGSTHCLDRIDPLTICHLCAQVSVADLRPALSP